MAAYLLANIPQRLTNASGSPAKYMWTYQSGTTTNKTAYTDQAAAVPHANPIVASADGSFAQVFLAGDADYTIKVLCEDGTTLFTWDHVSGTGSSLASLANSADSAQGDALVVVKQPFASAVARAQHAKNAEHLSAADFGAAGAVTLTDQTAIQAAATAAANGSGWYRVNSFVSSSIDLSALSLSASAVAIDERYASSGWYVYHCEGTDAQLGLRGRATSSGEGPSLVLQNLAASGNRNVSVVHWYGPTNAPVVASFEHWGYNADSTWYAGREYLTKGSVDTGSRARVRQGNDGGLIFNPNGDATSYLNNPATGFSSHIYTVWNAPLQSGYAKSGKPLGYMGATVTAFSTELRLQDDVGTTGAGVANAVLVFQTGHGTTAVDSYRLINNYPTTGQLTLRDAVNSVNLFSFNTGGSAMTFDTAIAAASVPNNSLFRDSADGKLKYKDNAGTTNALY